MPPVGEFLVELYVARGRGREIEGLELRTRAAADELTAEGTPVRLLRSIFVPEDETCFLLCEAVSSEAVQEAARRAGVRYERIAETGAGGGGGADVRS